MSDEEGWVTGPALEIILRMKAVQGGDLLKTRRGTFRVVMPCGSPGTDHTNPADKPFCLAPAYTGHWEPGMWANSLEPILAWKRPRKPGTNS